MHDVSLTHLRMNSISPVAFGSVVTRTLERANEFVGELVDSSRSVLVVKSTIALHQLNRLQDDNRVCLELRVQLEGVPWVSLMALIPLDGDGSLYDSATQTLRVAVQKLSRQRGE